MNTEEQQLNTLNKAVGLTASEVEVANVVLSGNTARVITSWVSKV